MAIPKKVADRVSAGLKRFKPVLESAKTRDVNESDTSMIVTDMLADVFGFDKYNDITREYAIRGTYCDLATKIDGKLQTLIEVKAHFEKITSSRLWTTQRTKASSGSY